MGLSELLNVWSFFLRSLHGSCRRVPVGLGRLAAVWHSDPLGMLSNLFALLLWRWLMHLLWMPDWRGLINLLPSAQNLWLSVLKMFRIAVAEMWATNRTQNVQMVSHFPHAASVMMFWPGPPAASHPQMITLPPPCFTVGWANCWIGKDPFY